MTTSPPAPPTERTVTRPATVRASKNRATTWLPPILVFLGLIGIWYAVTYVILDEQRRFLMPPPHEVVIAFFDPATFLEIMQALGRTTLVALVGLAFAIVIGVLWAVAMSQAKWVERSLYPYAVVLQCIPILALVPLIGFWFGFEYPARVIVCVMIALFPMVSNTLFGLQSVDPGQRELFQLQRAGRWTILSKLEFPAALPAIFAGMRISAGLAVVGAIVGDFFFRRGEPGLGSLLSTYTARLRSAELFATIFVAALLGVAIFALFGWIGKRVVGRWYDFSAN
ncbi:ABC transporter permease [Herbiconiux sp. CPCC 205763]|uniref:ABC transporter permease n=1 Tax=Herbiconiux aconitum TaxID=2970913 RepID=A0ABT2GS15_9MICO|nr:ABC transporter permease [Herbiconiux aconitum]MCS5718953.1 ABC transporter permease [Herbiconiux aconitum]